MEGITISQVVLGLFGVLQFGVVWVFSKIFQEIKESKAHSAKLYEKVAATREMVYEHRIEGLKEQLKVAEKVYVQK